MRRQPGSKRRGQRTPVLIQPNAAHLQNPADIGLGPTDVEKVRCVRGIGVLTVVAFEQPERHQGIEEVARAARRDSNPTAQCLGIERLDCEGREYAQLDGAE